MLGRNNTYYYDIVDGLIDEKICETKSKRPTLAEICEHHGYVIKGHDIVKKSEKISNCDKSYCETAMRLDEATSEINRLKAENAELKEKLEAVTDVDNQELERLRSENAEFKQKLTPFTQLGVVCEQISEVIKAKRDIDIIKLKHENNELSRKLVNNNQCLNLLQNEITGLEIRNEELQIKLREITSVINK